MESMVVAVGSALWLGILTSISPCPLATNIAAVSFIGKRVERPLQVLLAGALYTVGRMASYFAVAFIAIKSLISVPEVSLFLQSRMNQVLGPVLIIAGMLLLDVIPWPWIGRGRWTGKLQQKVEALGIWGAFLLGAVFALTFCPVSAALFFGSLLPLAVAHESSVLMPVLYGVGTALPVVAFSTLIAFAANRLAGAFNAVAKWEPWMRRVTALVFIGVGMYYCWMYIVI
ncbi:MAG: sulfite exporter TauE/SafE family protein [Deltaproteobacteria bacterium]|nr:sulfite exporter TauE/SafE family protein [Deltaproteobacteria bacterium]MBN2670279.1 sulfite exporter TauE/SafE family protein [Deltaproteobacteria bacterium]